MSKKGAVIKALTGVLTMSPLAAPVTTFAQETKLNVNSEIDNGDFYEVSKNYVFAADEASILESQDETSKVVGTIEKDGAMFVLSSADGWSYVESGKVRGFIQDDKLVTGQEAKDILSKYEKDIDKDDEKKDSVDDLLNFAKIAVPVEENAAYFYSQATTQKVKIDAVYGLVNAAEGLNVRESASTDAKKVGIMAHEAVCHIILDEGDWLYIESGDVRGFVSAQYVDRGAEVDAQVQEKGESSYYTAKALVDKENNDAYYYSLQTAMQGLPDGSIRSSVVTFAEKDFTASNGNVVDNNDVQANIDFTKGVYEAYNITFESDDDFFSQSKKISASDAKAGDVLVYENEEGKTKVAIATGDGNQLVYENSQEGMAEEAVGEDAAYGLQVIPDAPVSTTANNTSTTRSSGSEAAVTYEYSGAVLNKQAGVVYGPSGKETYYNLDMSTVVANAHARGIQGDYWIREDGAKMLGDYVMVAANLSVHPRGSLVATSLGTGIVVDTGGFVSNGSGVALDIATAW